MIASSSVGCLGLECWNPNTVAAPVVITSKLLKNHWYKPLSMKAVVQYSNRVWNPNLTFDSFPHFS